MVIVEPEGHVAMPNFEDQEFVFYNICEFSLFSVKGTHVSLS